MDLVGDIRQRIESLQRIMEEKTEVALELRDQIKKRRKYVELLEHEISSHRRAIHTLEQESEKIA